MSEIESGIDFNLTFAPGVTDEQIIGFELAGELWAQSLVDTYKGEDVQINLHVEVTDDLLPDGIIGGAFPHIKTNLTYKDIYEALENDITSETDQVVVDSLTGGKKFDIAVGENIIDNNKKLHATTANLKALGKIDGDKEILDGYIVINAMSDWDIWSYDYLNGPQDNQLDFLSVALHEIGHTLGFISGIDYQGWEETSQESNLNKVNSATILDLFRYSIESMEQGVMDLTFGKGAFLALGDVNVDLALSTGADYQGSHWIDSDAENGLGIMNPTLSLGERWSISNYDLLAMDAIGWDIADSGAIDLETLYEFAQWQAEDASIETRTKDVKKILDSEGYNWASRASYSGWWQTGYFSTYDDGTTSDTGEGSTTSSNETGDFYSWFSQLLNYFSSPNPDNYSWNTLFSNQDASSWGSWGSGDSDDSDDSSGSWGSWGSGSSDEDDEDDDDDDD